MTKDHAHAHAPHCRAETNQIGATECRHTASERSNSLRPLPRRDGTGCQEDIRGKARHFDRVGCGVRVSGGGPDWARGVSAESVPQLPPAWQGGAGAAQERFRSRGGRRGCGVVKTSGIDGGGRRQTRQWGRGATAGARAGGAQAGGGAPTRARGTVRGRRAGRGSGHAVGGRERLDLRREVRGAHGGPLQLLHHEPPRVDDVLRPTDRSVNARGFADINPSSPTTPPTHTPHT